MKQTKNGSESPRLAMTAKMLRAITFWTGFPVLLIITVLITQSFLSNPFVVVVETVVIFCLYLAVRAHFTRDCDDDEDFLRNHLMCLVTGAVVLRLTYNANIHLSPWGIIGWAILIGVLVLILGLGLITERKEQDTWKETLSSMNGWRPIAAFLLLALGAQQTYLHWATPWVWVPIGMTWLYIFTTTSPDFSWDSRRNSTQVSTTPFTLVLIAIGLISLIWQFWTSISGGIVGAWNATVPFIGHFVDVVIVDFWPYWVAALVTAGIVRVIFRRRQIRNEKIEAKLAEERIIKQDEQRKQNDAIRKEREKEQRENDLQELSTLTEKLASNETPEWKDIRRWKSLVYNLGLPANCAVDPDKIMTTPILPLFAHSKEKNQISYNGGLLRDIWELLDQTIQTCFDDEILVVIKKNLKDLKKLEGTIGYEDMLRNLKYEDRVRGFYEEEKQEVA